MTLEFTADYFEIATRSAVPSASAVDHVRVWVDAKGLIHTSDSGGSELQVPYVRAFNDADQSIAASSTVTVSFNTTQYDTDTIHDTATNFVCQTAGLYAISANVAFASDATGLRYLQLRVNAAVVGLIRATPINGNTTAMSITALYPLVVSDVVLVAVVQTTAGALNLVTAADYSPVFGMVRIGA